MALLQRAKAKAKAREASFIQRGPEDETGVGVCGESQAPTRPHPKPPARINLLLHPPSAAAAAAVLSFPNSPNSASIFCSDISSHSDCFHRFLQQWQWRWAWPRWPSPLPATRRSCAGPRLTRARRKVSSTGSATRLTRSRCRRLGLTSCSTTASLATASLTTASLTTASLTTARLRLLVRRELLRRLLRRMDLTSSARSEYCVSCGGFAPPMGGRKSNAGEEQFADKTWSCV